MSEVGIAERLFPIEFDVFGQEVENNFVKKDNSFIVKCRGLKQSLNDFVIVNKRIDVHSIPGCIKVIEKIKGKKVRLVCLDYIGLLKNKHFEQNEYSRITDNMSKLYSFAKELDIAIINLSQTSRVDVKGNENGLSLFSAKGSGEVENSSDFYLTLEKVIDNSKNTTDEIAKLNSVKKDPNLDLLKLTLHKNRRGKKGIIYITFNRKNLKIKEFNDNEIN